MDSPVQPTQQDDLTGQIACTTCGKRFRYNPALAGRIVKCPCGARIAIPRVQMPGRGAADVPMDDVDDDVDHNEAGFGIAASPPPPITVHLPPHRKGLKQDERNSEDDVAFKPSTMRDWVVPSVLIAIGIVLRFVEAMAPFANREPLPATEAIASVAIQLALSISLMVGGMFLAVHILEICLIGPLPQTAYKLVAIGVAPGAIYGILSVMGGETYGAMIGTFVSVIAYGLLFWLLMRLDLKDVSLCVILTWILVTAANYIAYKAQGMMQDSWV